jgi:hypothetical protein
MRASTLCVLALVLTAACVAPREDPTFVKDLRVLGMSFEPPEIQIPCDARLLLGLANAASDGGTIMLDPVLQARVVQLAASPLRFETLIADPAGDGRQLSYNALGCVKAGDRDCNDSGQYVSLKTGQTAGGVLSLQVMPGAAFLDDGQPLLVDVIQADTFKGLGGIRVPVVVDLKTLDKGEHIYAQKLMVYSCQLFPTQKANLTPRLRGFTWNGEAWPAEETKAVSGRTPVDIDPIDFSDLEEHYVVPSVQLQPVALQESWKINWLTTLGTMDTYETGGTDFAGTTGRHHNRWVPGPDATTAQTVTFSMVVRDGRGGESWETRTVRWTP